MEKIKRLFRKILRTILIWSTISALFVMHISAYIETINNPPNILVGNRTLYGDGLDFYAVAPYPFDYGTITDSTAPNLTEERKQQVIGLWQSRFYPDTFYKFSINVDIQQEDGTSLETGKLVTNGVTQWLNILPDDLFYSIDNTRVGVSQNAEFDIQPLLNDDYYSMFYDATSKTLSAIMYFPQSYFDEYPEKMQHVYIMMALGGNKVSGLRSEISIYQYTGTYAEGIYTDVLNQINQKLESLAGAGGGLTEEQVSAAVEEALQNHDESLKSEFDDLLNDADRKIKGELHGFQQSTERIYQSMSGITESLSYSGTNSVLTLPEARNPLANNALLWSRQTVDLAAAWLSLPQNLRNAISIVLSLLILVAVVKECIDIVRYLLGLGGAKDD